MIRAWRTFWIVSWSALISLVFIRNLVKYWERPIIWNFGKAILDTIVIVLSAIFLPPFLIAMNSAWIVSGIKKTWLKITLGIITGITLGVISSYAMEVLILLGIFSVDNKTNPKDGIIGRWEEVKQEEEVALAA